jgi:glyoxylase-like metal-dependent hydrolase (beta-lactamase superfamily II)
MSRIEVHALFDKPTSTLTYVVWDSASRDAVILDPVLDFDPATQMVSGSSMARLAKFVAFESLRVHWVLDTHAHADHLSAAKDMRLSGLAPAWGLGERMKEVFTTFKKTFAWPSSLDLGAMGVDRYFADGEEFTAGTLRGQAMNTPGHTAACLTYRFGDKLFTGDALFMPDGGVGRCDFPGGSASTLYDSVWNRLYALPDSLETYPGHDYQPGGRPLRWRATLGEHKTSNIHLKESTSREEFVRFREGRDKTLQAPRLLNPSLDWNLGAHQIVKRPSFSL